MFRGGGRGGAGGLQEGGGVDNPAAVIQRQHYVSAARQELIHRIRIRVVVHVVPPEQLLPHRPAMEKDYGWVFLSGSRIFRQKQLSVDLQSIAGFELQLLRLDNKIGPEIV